MSQPRILIGTPTHFVKNYCFDEWADNVMGLKGEFDLMIVDNSPNLNNANKYRKKFKPLGDRVKVVNHVQNKEEKIHPPTMLANCQNRLRQEALEEGYDYLFMLESDVFPHQDIIRHMVSRKADVYNVTYMIQKTMGLCVYTSCNYDYLQTTTTLMLDDATSSLLMGHGDMRLGRQNFGNFMQVSGCGVGCSLISNKVLRDVKFRASFEHDKKVGAMTFSDSFFHLEVNKKGYNNVLDTNYIATHKYSVKNPKEMDARVTQQLEQMEKIIKHYKDNEEIYTELEECKQGLVDNPEDKDLLAVEARLEKRLEAIDAGLNREQSKAQARAQEHHLTKLMEGIAHNAKKTQ